MDVNLQSLALALIATMVLPFSVASGEQPPAFSETKVDLASRLRRRGIEQCHCVSRDFQPIDCGGPPCLSRKTYIVPIDGKTVRIVVSCRNVYERVLDRWSLNTVRRP